jgi:hypothetical protein
MQKLVALALALAASSLALPSGAQASQLTMSFGYSIPCNSAPSSVVGRVLMSGGNGTPITFALKAGDLADFKVRPSGVIVIGDKGIDPSRCGTNQKLTIAATQSGVGSATATAQITIQQPLVISANPPEVTMPCTSPPDTFISALSAAGGNGNPVTYRTTAGDTSDFAMSGADLVVGPNGIDPAHCPPAGQTNTLDVTVTGSQP